MKNLILLTFLFISHLVTPQQIVNKCDFSKQQFTYTTYTGDNGTYTWDINGNFQNTSSNSMTIDWSGYEIGSYTITVYFENLSGCSAEPVTFEVFIKECNESLIHAPNAFTPDKDQYNDVWKPITYNIESGNYIIFNRWGEVIFESFDLDVGWPGTYGVNGEIVKDGVYIYVINYIDINGVLNKISGHINLLK